MSAQEQSTTATEMSTKDRLILAIRRLFDLNVEVHIRDGSVFSGIFHTGTFENEYCICLRDARMTKKGEDDANVNEGDLIPMLIIESDDFTKIVVKEDELSSEGKTEDAAVAETTALKEEQINQTRHTGDDISLREHVGCSEQIVDAVKEGPSLPLDYSGIQESDASSSSSVFEVTSEMHFHTVAVREGSELNQRVQHWQRHQQWPHQQHRQPQQQWQQEHAHYQRQPGAPAAQYGVGVFLPAISHMGSWMQPAVNAWRFPFHAVPSNSSNGNYHFLWQQYVDNHSMQQTYMQHPNMQYAYAYAYYNMGYTHPPHIVVWYPYGYVMTYGVVGQANPQGNLHQVWYPNYGGMGNGYYTYNA